MDHVAQSPFVSSANVNESYSFTLAPTEHLSAWDAHQILKTKKIVLLEPRDFPFNSTWKTVNVNLFLQGLIIGYWVFAAVSNNKATISHQLDTTRQYEYPPVADHSRDEFNKIFYAQYGMSEKGVWTDHTQDLWIPGNIEGAKAFFPIAFIPPILPYFAWKTLNFASKAFTFCQNFMPNRKNRDIDDLDILLLATSKKNKEIPCPSNLISELLDLELLEIEQFQVLSFSQIRNLKIQHPERFIELLKDDKFSKSQTLYWNKLKLMASASANDVSKAIMNSENCQMFEDEPEMLEVFIQEIKTDRLTDIVKEVLASKLRLIHKHLLNLKKQDVVKIIEEIHKNKWSVEKAYKSHFILEDELDNLPNEILFHFLDENNKKVSISACIGLLSQSSDTFKAMIHGHYKESNSKEIDLSPIDPYSPRIDPNSFKELIGYLKTGKLDFDQIDVINLLHLAKTYFFTELHQKIENELVNTIVYFYDKLDIKEYLDLSNTYGLAHCKIAIDLKKSKNLPLFYSDDFLELLKEIKEFSLPITFKKIVKAMIKNMENLTKDKKFSDHFVEAIIIHPALLDDLALAITTSISNNHKLLGKLWDAAIAQNADFFLDRLVKFCQKNPHVALANWDMLPTRHEEFVEFESIQIEEI